MTLAPQVSTPLYGTTFVQLDREEEAGGIDKYGVEGGGDGLGSFVRHTYMIDTVMHRTRSTDKLPCHEV